MVTMTECMLRLVHYRKPDGLLVIAKNDGISLAKRTTIEYPDPFCSCKRNIHVNL